MVFDTRLEFELRHHGATSFSVILGDENGIFPNECFPLGAVSRQSPPVPSTSHPAPILFHVVDPPIPRLPLDYFRWGTNLAMIFGVLTSDVPSTFVWVILDL